MIEVAPLAYMRGRTLNDSFIILDEAQNTTPEQMKMFLTRLGLRQHGWSSPATSPRSTCPAGDSRDSSSCGDVLADITDIAFIRFDQRDVVRHKLVQRIVAAYKDHGERRADERETGGRGERES